MTQMPPDMEAHEEELRRRLEAANGPLRQDEVGAPAAVAERESVRAARATTRSDEVSSVPRVAARLTLPLAIGTTVLIGLAVLVFTVVLPAINNARTSVSVEQALEEGPPFASTLSAEGVRDAYLTMWGDGSIAQYLPAGDEGAQYFKAFMWASADYVALDAVTGKDKPGDHEEVIELERRFLAGEDLGVEVDITLADGTRFVHDGSAPDGE